MRIERECYELERLSILYDGACMNAVNAVNLQGSQFVCLCNNMISTDSILQQ